MADSEEEIYSIMFTSLKHPVRRKILRMLNDKPMTFMEMVEHIGVSSSHLTYHLESLGELVYKMDDGRYKLSSFGRATVSAMKGVEDAPEIETKRPKKLAPKWKTVFAALMAAVIVLAAFSAVQTLSLNQLAATQTSLTAQNQQLLSWGTGTGKAASLLNNIAQIDTTQYKITMMSNTLQYRTDLLVTEEVLKYSLASSASNLDADFRFRENHLSRYQLTAIESAPLLSQNQPSNILDAAKAALSRYQSYSGDSYLEEMSSLLASVNQTQSATVASGNMKLQITITGENAEFLWMYTERGIDYTAKSLRLTFQNRVLTGLTDGYFLFTIANTDLKISQQDAVDIAKNHIKTLTWTIDGQQTSGFIAQDQPVSVELAPHTRGSSVALVPYWYVVLRLDKTYSDGINTAAVGIYADTGEAADVQMLSG